MDISAPVLTDGIRQQFRIAEFCAASRTNVRNHAHDCWHIFVLKSGSCEEAGADGNGVIVKPGMIRLSSPGVGHNIDFGDAESDCLVLHLYNAQFKAALGDTVAEENTFVPDNDLYQDLILFCDDAQDPVHHFSSPLKIRRWLRALASIAATGEPYAVPVWLADAHEEICDNGEKSTIENVSKRTGVSREHLSRSFKKYFGYSPVSLRERRLLDKAIATALNENVSLSEASLAAGFFDQSHFTNAFTRAAGISPARFLDARRA